MSVKNQLIKACILLVKACRKKAEKRASSSKRFLIVSTTGLGDTLWGTPAIRTLRHSFPDAYIAVLTSEIGKQVLENNPHIDELFTIAKAPLISLLRLFLPLRKKKIDTVLVFHLSQRPVLPFCFLIGAKRFIGTAGINKDLDFILTDPLPAKRIHEIARRLEIASSAGANSNSSSLEIYPSDADQKELLSFLEKYAVAPYIPLIALHPGAKDRFKQWNPACFIEVGQRLMDHLGCQVVITGTAEERALVHSIASEIPGAIPISGELKLGVFSALMKRLSLFITNDTGPMHVAFASLTPTVALFSPTDPMLCGPYFASHVEVIAKPRTCSPCLRKKCHDPFCMLQISVEEVYQSALSLFYNSKEENR